MEKIKLKELKSLPKLLLYVAIVVALITAFFIPVPMVDTLGSLIRLMLMSTFTLIIMIVFHEAMHGVCFKYFTGKVTFGFMWKKLAAYASSPNSLMTKKEFIITALSPQLLNIPCLISIFFAHNSVSVYLSLIFLLMNFFGGVSDFWMAFTLSRFPKDILVEDTMAGAIIYQVVSNG